MQYQNRRNKRVINKKLLLLLLLLTVLVIGSVFFYKSRNDKRVTDETNPPGTEKIDLSPPTEVDKQEAERNKQRLIEDEQAESTEPTPGIEKQKVTPIIGFLQQASNGNVEANGYITEAIESDGTCTLTLEKNGEKTSKDKQAMPDAQSTICGLIVIERSQLSAGEWKATISYSSTKHQGVSEERSIQVN